MSCCCRIIFLMWETGQIKIGHLYELHFKGHSKNMVSSLLPNSSLLSHLHMGYLIKTCVCVLAFGRACVYVDLHACVCVSVCACLCVCRPTLCMGFGLFQNVSLCNSRQLEWQKKGLWRLYNISLLPEVYDGKSIDMTVSNKAGTSDLLCLPAAGDSYKNKWLLWFSTCHECVYTILGLNHKIFNSSHNKQWLWKRWLCFDMK